MEVLPNAFDGSASQLLLLTFDKTKDHTTKVRTKKLNFRCDICQKPFSKNAYLARHMVTHTGEKNFECHICGKKFSQNPHLRTHMKIHTSEKSWICSVCGKGFFQKSNLTTHMVTHTGERNHRCEVCGKGFSQKTNLNTHMVSHTGGYEFICDYCEKGFSRFSHLKRHLISHTGEKNFRCDLCGKNYTMNSSLERHKLTLHNNEWVENQRKRKAARKPMKCKGSKENDLNDLLLKRVENVQESTHNSLSITIKTEAETFVIETDPSLFHDDDDDISNLDIEHNDHENLHIKTETDEEQIIANVCSNGESCEQRISKNGGSEKECGVDHINESIHKRRVF
ncbi:zinc finger protein 239-like [Macrobrachium nipponense]|uniref:zinc finger protein 239-like n=1 Tax=Macrobrachium nipponense TaxID=159736 RepID=UPI0030C81844